MHFSQSPKSQFHHDLFNPLRVHFIVVVGFGIVVLVDRSRVILRQFLRFERHDYGIFFLRRTLLLVSLGLSEPLTIFSVDFLMNFAFFTALRTIGQLLIIIPRPFIQLMDCAFE